jgi:hypothetical protein
MAIARNASISVRIPDARVAMTFSRVVGASQSASRLVIMLAMF